MAPAAVWAVAVVLAVAATLSGLPGVSEAAPSFPFPATQNRAESNGRDGGRKVGMEGGREGGRGDTCPSTF